MFCHGDSRHATPSFLSLEKAAGELPDAMRDAFTAALQQDGAMPTWLLSLAKDSSEQSPSEAAENTPADETAQTPETLDALKLEARTQLANYRRLARNLGPISRTPSVSVARARDALTPG